MRALLGGFRVRIAIAIVGVAIAAVVAALVATSATPDTADPPSTTIARVEATLAAWGADHISYPEQLLRELEQASGYRIVIAAVDGDTVIGDSRGDLVAYRAPATDPHAFADPLRQPLVADPVKPYPIDGDIADDGTGGAPADPVEVWLNPPTGSGYTTTIGALALIAIVVCVATVAYLLSTAVLRPLDRAIRGANALARGERAPAAHASSIVEVNKLNEAIDHLDRRLRDAAERRRAVIDELAHEIRTPLTSALGHLRGVSEGYFDADDELIDGTINDLELLERLVADLRTVTTAEQHQLVLRREPVDLERLVTRAVAGELGGRRAVIDVPDVVIETDPQRTEQIVRNLLSNAKRFSPPSESITIAATHDEDAITVTVTDRGPGIAAADLERVFERFYRADSARSPNDQSTGLGLSIARALTRAQGGELIASNAPGGGAAFTLTLPTEPGPDGERDGERDGLDRPGGRCLN